MAHDKAERLGKSGATVHVPEWREAENYVPTKALMQGGNYRAAARKVRLLQQLTPDQRGHFDMKKGFGPPDQPPVIHQAQVSLYRNISLEARTGLRGGFGNRLLQHLYEIADSLGEKDFAALGSEAPRELRRMLQSVSSVI